MYQNIISEINKLYNDSDYLTLINYSKTNEIQTLVEKLKNFEYYIKDFNEVIPVIKIFILIGIANYQLRKYKFAIKYFEISLEAFKKINRMAYIFDKFKDSNVEFITEYIIAFKQLIENNKFLEPILYGYIAHSHFKSHNPIFASFNYCIAVKKINNLQLNCPAHKDFYVDILSGRSDAYYELTKIYITTIKIVFYVTCMYLILKPFIYKIISLYLALYHIFNPIVIILCSVIGILTLPKVLYKIFYFLLRKLRRFISINFIQLFPEPIRNMFVSFLNWINLKKILSHKTHKEAIEKIEKVGEQNFNIYFAIAKLYYCLGQYKNSSFYIQKALFFHNKQYKSELAMAYHYLARIAYKTSNNLTAIDLYNKTIENLMNINKDDKNCKAEFLPSIADMISYTQENRNKIEQTTFSRTYFPLIVTLIITIIVCLAQIYYCISSKEPEAILIFDKAEKYYSKIIN